MFACWSIGYLAVCLVGLVCLCFCLFVCCLLFVSGLFKILRRHRPQIAMIAHQHVRSQSSKNCACAVTSTSNSTPKQHLHQHPKLHAPCTLPSISQKCFGMRFGELFEVLVTERAHFCDIDARVPSGMQVTAQAQFAS